MTWTPRLLALDIDGTLVDHDQQMPEEVHAAVQRVLASGTPVALATGRGWFATKPIADHLGLPPGPHVSSNGAVVVDYPPFQLRSVKTFDPEPVIRRVAELAPNAAIAVEVVGRGFRLNKHFPEGDLTGEITIETLDELCAEPASRVVIRDPEAEWASFERLAEEVGLHGVSYAIGWSTWLDIAPDGVNKASALAEVCEHYGVAAEDVLALGDGYNDVEMLQWAGRGVAIGDAPDGVKQAADHVTGRFADLGTAEELSRWW